MYCRAGSYLRKRWLALVVACIWFACNSPAALAETKRLVVIKCDGLPYDLVDRLVKQRDNDTGKRPVRTTTIIPFDPWPRLPRGSDQELRRRRRCE